MDEQAKASAFMSALVTEHFVLQSAASTTVSEAAARASLYVLALSSSLVAMGFAAQSADAFVPITATILPTLFSLGVFTIVRLVDTGVENLQFLSSIAHIRRYYRSLSPDAVSYFRVWGNGEDEAAEALGMLSLKRSWVIGLFTTASMVAVINSIVAGAGSALFARWVLDVRSTGLAVLLGVSAALLVFVAFFVYQKQRYSAFEAPSPRRSSVS